MAGYLGAKGWGAENGSFMPDLSDRLFDLTVSEGDHAAGRRPYDRMKLLIDFTDGQIARTKATLDLVCMPCGAPRAPRLCGGAEDVAVLRRMLVDIGIVAESAA